MRDSRIPGFYRLDPQARRLILAERFGLREADLDLLAHGGALSLDVADKMVENCIGVFGLPIGLGLNFTINGRDYAVPMAVEEPSIIAAVSNVARLLRPYGGFTAEADPSLMIAQIQLLDVVDMDAAAVVLQQNKAALLAHADEIHPNMARRGAGARDLEIRRFGPPYPMMVLHLIVDCADAMGANAVNAMAEGLAPEIERLTGGRVNLRILSNLADKRLARARFNVPEAALCRAGMAGEAVAAQLVEAYQFAAVDPYRAATHNKGIMNGIDAVAIATGNDWRGIEAGAHAYAAREGRYSSLTRFWRASGQLHGEIELPLAVGTVGGSTRVHAALALTRQIMPIDDARELAGVMAAVGLAQNTGALLALASEGIQRGHMRLHARSVALAAGAEGVEVERVAAELIRRGAVKVDVAAEILGRA
ncbi:hydroxymethylglutaryl-CoA reductase, degradative [Myxococcota bacterium]|nr:hydroxymethylglutaryl-CoA reductase, degradative [Myxococcota bacterium]MBU1900564.1 hydroxymethylglutaryl-CoA reductase, degradative [Myxococcota bacterium]